MNSHMTAVLSLGEGQVFSVKDAVSYQPGATPQDSWHRKTKSAESANHSRALNRAFSARDGLHRGPEAMPQARSEVAPLALNTYRTGQAIIVRMI
jgi:hypothetical protein